MAHDLSFLTRAVCLAALTLPLIPPSVASANDWFPDELAPGIFKVKESRKQSFADVGVAVLSRKGYKGSDVNHTDIYPYLSAEYKGRWFARPYDGVGVNITNTKPFVLATSIGYNGGRKGDDTPYKNDVFSYDPGIAWKISNQIRFKYGAILSSYSIPISGDLKGAYGNVRLGTLLPVSKQIRISPSIKFNYESAKRLTQTYGINASQNAISNTGLLTYGEGISSYELTLAAYWRSPDKKYQFLGGVTYRDLLGDLKDSPLTPKDNSLYIGVGAARRY